MIMMKNVYFSTLWIMRIVVSTGMQNMRFEAALTYILYQPGVAILHTAYGIYHLFRKASRRTPGTSASYMFFASFFDLSIVPFYGFGAYVTYVQGDEWETLLPGSHIRDIFTTSVFYCAAAGGGLFLISFGLSMYLAVTFRKITNLPPDMNPLEDHLTSRHKRNKSSISTATTMSEKRISAPLQSNRSSATVCEDLTSPPTISFLQTRAAGSTDSFSTYKTTPPPSRDSRLDLPSRQYQIKIHSARSSAADLKRGSYGASSPPKRASYTEIPLADTGIEDSPRKIGNIEEAWYTAKSLNSKQSRASSPEKGVYEPLDQPYDSENYTLSLGHPNPLEANPPTPRHSVLVTRDSPLSEISNNRSSGDIADLPSPIHEMPSIRDFKAKRYGELRAGTPPVLVGLNRQVSSGTDYPNTGGWSKSRDVSGKIAEEGRGGERGGWGSRFRKISGLR